MKKDSTFFSRLILIFLDLLAILFSFFFAYYFRTHLSSRPYFFTSDTFGFLREILFLAPVWILVLASLGLYSKHLLARHSRTKEIARLFIASLVGLMALISCDSVFSGGDLFPVHTLILYSFLLCFFFLSLNRTLYRAFRDLYYRHGHGTLNAIIIGNNKNTDYLADFISSNPESGYRLVGIVAAKKFFPKDLRGLQYSSLKDALRAHPDVVFQTDERRTEYVYRQSLDRHLFYYFVPGEVSLASQLGELELIGNTPTIRVSATPLLGNAKYLKRFMDLLLGSLIFLLALLPMLIIWLIVKLSDPAHPALYSEYRLSQFNKKFKIYKFRSMRPEYSGLSPEDAFKKMGKPDLTKIYRKNGDYLKNDPRITPIGRFLRRTSLDELPQLWNVLRGDISLIGPRALVPGELKAYGDRSLLLTVKSGLTGLAQVSGRRNISFEERRALDLYYIKNWSLALDFQILLRTIKVVFLREGAK